MGFRFPLETLLRVRQITELREERLLGQIINQIAQARQNLADLKAQRSAIIAQRHLALEQQTPAVEVTRSYEAVRMIDGLERTGAVQLGKLEAMRDQQMIAYKLAHRNHELLSGIREKKLAHYQHDQDRKEQNAMDDNFSSRKSLR